MREKTKLNFEEIARKLSSNFRIFFWEGGEQIFDTQIPF